MRSLIILAAALLAAAANGSELVPREIQKALAELFPLTPIACPEGVPDACVCGEFANRTDLPMRYTRVQHCPHPLVEAIVNVKTFATDGALINDMMLKNGQMHGAVISRHPNGRVAGIANYEEGRQIGYARVWHDNGTLFAEQQFVDGERHGKDIRYSRDGTLEMLVIWDHGDVDREETRRLSRSLGIEAPFDRVRPTASHEGDGPSE